MRVPLDIVVLEAMTAAAKLLGCEALASGLPQFDWDWFTFAALVSAAFSGMLRPAEVVALRPELVRCPTAGLREVPWAVVALERPKNRRALGRLQHATIRDIPTTM